MVLHKGTAATYTGPGNPNWVKITAVGGGGSASGGVGSRSTGGSGAGVAIKWLTMTAGQTLIYTVGGAAADSTVSSGTLTLAANIVGGGGVSGGATAFGATITTGSQGGTATGGDINIQGGNSQASYGTSTTVATNFSGGGGDCPGFGTGGSPVALANAIGQAGTGFGAGAGGAINNASTATGRSGVIIFEAM